MPAHKNISKSVAVFRSLFLYAGIAQLVEQLIRNEQAAGSSPITSSKIKEAFRKECFLYFNIVGLEPWEGWKRFKKVAGGKLFSFQVRRRVLQAKLAVVKQ